MKIIKTKRLLLRPMTLKDAKDVAKNIGNWNVIRNISAVPFPYELKHAKQFIGRIQKKMAKENPTNFLLAIEIDGEVVGAIGAHNIVHGHKAEIGYWLAEKCWGKGIMSEAMAKFVAYIFSEFKLRRVCAYAYKHNIGSTKVMEKVGMQYEGIAKKYALKNGKYIDCYIYAKVK